VIRLTKSRSRIRFKALPRDDPRQRKPDIRLAKRRLKWSPQVRLEDGLKETIRYFRRVLRK
jgi:UDP-glucuronate decarboxylase